MTDADSPHLVDSATRSQTLRFQKLVNPVVRGLLRAPLISRAIGKRLVTIYVVGRKTGRRYAVPVAYTRHNGTLLVASGFRWIRNLRSSESVDIRLAGRRTSAASRVLTEESDVVEHLALMVADNHHFAKFNKIGFDANGTAAPEDLHLAWSAGISVVVLTPR